MDGPACRRTCGCGPGGSTGVADGQINADPDVFFASVITSGSFTSDPRIRYDRLSGRWILTIIDVATPKAAEVLKKAQENDDTEHKMYPFIEKFKSMKEAVAKFGRI